MKLYVSEEQMRQARRDLGNPAALDEAIIATGIDAFFALLDGFEVTLLDGRVLRLENTE